MNQDALVVFPTVYGRNVCDCKRAKQHEQRLAVYQHHQRSDCQSKITWIQVCVLARHKLWRFLIGKTLSTTFGYRACMLLWKRITIFPRNMSCQSSYFRWKLFVVVVVVVIFFLRFPGWNWKNCRHQSRPTFSSRGFPARFRGHGYAARTCASTQACSEAKFSL